MYSHAFRSKQRKSFTISSSIKVKQNASLFSSYTQKTMGFRLPGIKRASFATRATSAKSGDVPKGYLAIYVGEGMKRFVIPISYLNQPSFQELLSEAEEEFGYDRPMGALTIPCTEDVFLKVTSSFNG